MLVFQIVPSPGPMPRASPVAVIVAAAGNEQANSLSYPAALPGVVSVGVGGRGSEALVEAVRGLDGADNVAIYTFSRNLSRAANLTRDRNDAISGLRKAVAGDDAALALLDKGEKE